MGPSPPGAAQVRQSQQALLDDLPVLREDRLEFLLGVGPVAVGVRGVDGHRHAFCPEDVVGRLGEAHAHGERVEVCLFAVEQELGGQGELGRAGDISERGRVDLGRLLHESELLPTAQLCPLAPDRAARGPRFGARPHGHGCACLEAEADEAAEVGDGRRLGRGVTGVCRFVAHEDRNDAHARRVRNLPGRRDPVVRPHTGEGTPRDPVRHEPHATRRGEVDPPSVVFGREGIESPVDGHEADLRFLVHCTLPFENGIGLDTSAVVEQPFLV